MKHGYKIFDEYGTSGKKVRWVDNPEWFARWKDGQTGMPLVDANMREIKETGTCCTTEVVVMSNCSATGMPFVTSTWNVAGSSRSAA